MDFTSTTSRPPCATPSAACSKGTTTTSTAARPVADDPGFDEDLWGRLAEMGVLGLPFTEDDGGMGAGPVEVSVVAEELGRVIAPEPFVEAVVLAGGLVAAVGSDEQKKRDPAAALAPARSSPLAAADTRPAVAGRHASTAYALSGVRRQPVAQRRSGRPGHGRCVRRRPRRHCRPARRRPGRVRRADAFDGGRPPGYRTTRPRPAAGVRVRQAHAAAPLGEPGGDLPPIIAARAT